MKLIFLLYKPLPILSIVQDPVHQPIGTEFIVTLPRGVWNAAIEDFDVTGANVVDHAYNGNALTFSLSQVPSVGSTITIDVTLSWMVRKTFIPVDKRR